MVPLIPSSANTVPPPRGGMSVKQCMMVNALPEESKKKRYLFSVFQLEVLIDIHLFTHQSLSVCHPFSFLHCSGPSSCSSCFLPHRSSPPKLHIN